MMLHQPMAALALTTAVLASASDQDLSRPGARDLGIRPGIFQPGPHNAIHVTDVLVGQTTAACSRFSALRGGD